MDEPGAATSAWSSGLSTAEFAAGAAAGLEPLGFVQGCSVISWNWYGSGQGLMGGGGLTRSGGGFYEQFDCPHGFVSMEHRLYGCNFELDQVTRAWQTGYSAALSRLVEEASGLGAHGVIGIVQRNEHRAEINAQEFTLQGTAVAVPGVERPATPFTTSLAGAKLIKLLEAGLAPVSIASGVAAIQVYPSCVTEYLSRGTGMAMWGSQPGGELVQISRAHATAREICRRRIRDQLAGDTLHGARFTSRTHEVGGLGPAIEVSIFGNRVRRFKDFDPLPLPRPVVRLTDR